MQSGLLHLVEAAHAAPRHFPDTEAAGLVVGFVGVGVPLGRWAGRRGSRGEPPDTTAA